MDNMKKELMLIKDLMDKLVDEMEPTSDDFDEALGKPKMKPEIEAIKIEGVIPEESDMEMEDEEMEEPEMEMPEMMDEEESPEEALKRRIMKMRE